jgi:hypothetical protein
LVYLLQGAKMSSTVGRITSPRLDAAFRKHGRSPFLT